MHMNAMYAWCIVAGFIPFLLAVVTVAHYCASRIRLRLRKRAASRRSRLYSYCVAAGMAFLQLVRVFYQPDLAYVLEAKQDQDADEDDSGDPDSPEGRLKHFHRQLKRIRRGQPVDRLEWKM
jgi:hypothetical protein